MKLCKALLVTRKFTNNIFGSSATRQKDYAPQAGPDQSLNPWPPDHYFISCPWDTCPNHLAITLPKERYLDIYINHSSSPMTFIQSAHTCIASDLWSWFMLWDGNMEMIYQHLMKNLYTDGIAGHELYTVETWRTTSHNCITTQVNQSSIRQM